MYIYEIKDMYMWNDDYEQRHSHAIDNQAKRTHNTEK